jgi:hypothetical protein
MRKRSKKPEWRSENSFEIGVDVGCFIIFAYSPFIFG